MSLTLDELNKLVRDTVIAVVNPTTVIRYYPNAPRPKDDFCTVNIFESVPVGISDKTTNNSGEFDLTEKFIALTRATISVNFYRQNARQQANVFFQKLLSQTVVDSWNASDVGMISRGSVRDLSGIQDMSHEERAQVDIVVEFVLTTVEEEITGIRFVNIEGEIDNGVEVVETIDISIALSLLTSWEWNDLTLIEWNDLTPIDLN